MSTPTPAPALATAPRGRQEDDAWRQRVAEAPDDPAALNELANLCKEKGRLADAETLYRRAIALRADNHEALNNLGNLLKALRHPAEAERCLRAALALRPDHPDIRSNLGVLLHEQRHFAAAEAHFRAILLAVPTHIEALNNLGNLLKDMRRLDEAETCYRQLLARQPAHPEARWNLGLLRLLRGDADEGWRLYEARHDPRRQNREVTPPRLPTPAWKGEPLRGGHLVVWHEQGHGDEIMFARYLPYLRREFGAGRVTVVCKPALQALLSTVAGVDLVLPLGAAVPPHDAWVLCGSLPGLFAATRHRLPTRQPYVAVPPAWRERWRGKLPTRRALRVGLVWAGSTLHKNDHNRSLPSPALLAPLWQVPGIEFISLQIDRSDGLPGHLPIFDCGPNLTDFADSAALLCEIDLLVTVDTALAHLAGALGRPCWVMLPWLGIDWRWGESGEHSHWYPGSLRLFRQPAPDAWPVVIGEIAQALAAWTGDAQQRHHRLAALSATDRQCIERTVDRLLVARAHARPAEKML